MNKMDKDADNLQCAGLLGQMKVQLQHAKDAIMNRDKAFDWFYTNFKFLKGFGILFLCMMAYANWYLHSKSTQVIKDNSTEFLIESMLFGLSGVLPFLMLIYLRDNGHMSTFSIVFTCLLLFLLFVGLNYVLEICGLWGLGFGYSKKSEDEEDKKEDKKEDDKKDTPKPFSKDEFQESYVYASGAYMTFIFVAVAVIMVLCLPLTRVFDPEYVELTNIPKPILFLIEALLFGMMSAVPVYLMAYNRGKFTSHTTKEFAIITLKFFILHIVLQISGCYKYWFRGELPTGAKPVDTCK